MIVPRVVDEGYRLRIDWPDPRPESFEITAGAFEELVELVNAERFVRNVRWIGRTFA